MPTPSHPAPDAPPPSWRKAVMFFGIIATILTGALGMSLYKIAVANAYVTQKLPAKIPARQGPPVGDAARGAHLAALVGCADCHGADFGGATLVDRAGYATIIAPNLTAGVGGRGRELSDDQLGLIVQAGLDGEQRMLWAMPRQSLNALARDDVAALVAYLRTLPPVDRQHKKNRLDFWGYIDVALRRLRIVDRAPIPVLPPKIPRPSIGLDNAVVSFGAEPQQVAAWREHAPSPSDADFAPYIRAVSGCDACHGNGAPMVGRTQAPALDANAQQLERCQVGGRLRHLTSDERAAIFEGL